MTESVEKRCGFIAILGPSNVGKSTLVNQIVGHKVAIVTPKVQTTRQRILGVICVKDSQLILVDTPGIFTPKKRLDKAMVQAAWTAAQGADAVCVMIDVALPKQDLAHTILKKLAPQPITLILNKIDKIKRPRLLALVADFTNRHENISNVFMISALKGDGVTDLKQHFAQSAPISPWLYPEDQLTDMPLRLWAAEITREQILLRLHQEIPYSCLVESETWEPFDNGSIKIQQAICVTRSTHKAIILGKGGHQIKAISQAARHEMSTYLNCPVHLFLHVKVVEDWQNRRQYYQTMGLSYDSV